MDYKIACVIVTYNRKQLLIRCLEAVSRQTFKPQTVFIMDNASADGTEELVKERGYYNCKRDRIEYKYILNSMNEGGAGGFYLGMKTANESADYDALWVMDDDGEPYEDCLEKEAAYLDKYAFISPLVVTPEDSNILSFYNLNTKEFLDQYPDGIIADKANPFNGILFRRDLLEKIGYPKKEMFIWGDEKEYQQRAISNGFYPVTIAKARHKHPKDRMEYQKDFMGRNTIVYVGSKLRNYCFYRNQAYIIKKYHKIINIFYFVVSYYFFFLVIKKLDLNGLRLFNKAVTAGLRGDFSGHFEYV